MDYITVHVASPFQQCFSMFTSLFINIESFKNETWQYKGKRRERKKRKKRIREIYTIANRGRQLSYPSI